MRVSLIVYELMVIKEDSGTESDRQIDRKREKEKREGGRESERTERGGSKRERDEKGGRGGEEKIERKRNRTSLFNKIYILPPHPLPPAFAPS